ncbi:patatin-like phospholipase family protein [candidate division KSB1 bacterium]|nr:patatin-like phospholipase family protein [candidate division KSB1 bacterium]
MKPILILFFLIAVLNISSEYIPAAPQSPKVPKIGLVLSGGGAKGFAHIGVLKVLEEAGIQADVVTGTSMGSIIGGLYAIGYDAKTLEKIILEQNWVNLFNDTFTRRGVSIQEKDELSRYVGGFPIYQNRINLPSGLLAGQKVSALLSRLTWSVHHVENFDDFPRPFRCVATDLETGEPVVLNKGNLPEAIRASMAIPSVFTPVELDGKLLIDGAISRNLPVQEALDMGADFIIAVDVGDPLYPREDLNSLVFILNQTINFQTVASTNEQIPLCNIYIRPEIDQYHITDFFKADSLIKYGELAARAVLPRLDSIADSIKTLGGGKSVFAPVSNIKHIKIVDLNVSGLCKVSRRLVEAKLNIKMPSKVTLEELDKAINRIYGSQFFERVTYRLQSSSDGCLLVIHVVEKTANFLNFGLHYTLRHDAAILLNASFRNLLGHGSKLSIDNRLGHCRETGINYFYNTNFKPGIGIGLDIRARRCDFDLFRERYRIARYDFDNFTLGLVGQTIISNSVTVGTKIERQRAVLNPNVVSTQLAGNKIISDYFSIQVFFDWDTFDHAYFPANGARLHIDGKRFSVLDHKKTGIKSFQRYFFNYQQAMKLSKRQTFLFNLIAGGTRGPDIPMDQLFYFGGYFTFEKYMFPFAGLDFMGLAAKNLFVCKGGLQYEIFDDNYVIMEINAGFWDDRFLDLFSTDENMYSAGLTYGVDTPLGPVKLSVSSNDRDKKIKGYLSIGHWF